MAKCFVVPQLALWKSTVSHILAQQAGKTHNGAYSADENHPLIQAVNAYGTAMEEGNLPANPGHDSTNETDVQTWLCYLWHKKAHAHIAGDTIQENELEAEIARYKFGNPLWQQMFIQYYTYYWQYPYHKGAVPQYRSWQDKNYGNGNLQYGVIQWKLPAHARIAIVGDIGTGTQEAANVLRAACKFSPDVILHLGDVYYSGTPEETRHRLVDMVKSVLKEEQCSVPFFTIPGNHEYFTGNVSLLQALDSNELIVQPNQKQEASYFCLQTEDGGWQFLGMDTGYYGHYMNVAKGASKATLQYLHIGEVENAPANTDPHWPADHNPYFTSLADLPQKDTTTNVPVIPIREDELAWHTDKLNTFTGKTVLLSHHQLYSAHDTVGVAQATLADGKTPDPANIERPWVNTALWKQFGGYVGKQVPLWLWGHEHNLQIYADNYRPADWPTDEKFIQEFGNLPKGRCAGHSALPVQNTEDPYKQNYPVPLVNEQVKLGLTQVGQDLWYNHGFQILELRGKNNPALLCYYEIAVNNDIPSPLYIEYIP